jgi:hypothetical protein
LESGDGVFHTGSRSKRIFLCVYGDVAPSRAGRI